MLKERAILWREMNWLIISDLHLGKSETFRNCGIPIPAELDTTDLDRLSFLVTNYKPDRLIIAGDFIHHDSSLTEHTNSIFTSWRKKHPLPIWLVEGNHDRGISLPNNWNINYLTSALRAAPFIIDHKPPEQVAHPIYFGIYGHIHPVSYMEVGGRSIRVQVFYKNRDSLILPAFTNFAGGWNVSEKNEEAVYFATGEAVFSRKAID